MLSDLWRIDSSSLGFTRLPLELSILILGMVFGELKMTSDLFCFDRHKLFYKESPEVLSFGNSSEQILM